MHVLTNGAPRAPTARRAAPAATPAPTEWLIRPGDNLWRVAADTLAARQGRPASDAAVAAYLDLLVERNAGALVVPGHPELVYPGQRFALPPIPPALT